jgi:predicted lipid-binding transport protein (Tim44 family)
MARTAVVAGTATAVSNRVSRRQANRWAAQEPQYDNANAYAAAPAPVEAAADPYEQLSKLAELKDRGVLSSAEFEVEKAKILRG